MKTEKDAAIRRAFSAFPRSHPDDWDAYGEATVHRDAEVDPGCVSGRAIVRSGSVTGNARVTGHARVYGNAQVSGNALVTDIAHVYDNAQVYGNAIVRSGAQVLGSARVFGGAQVTGNAWLVNYAKVYGDARVYDNAVVSGKAQVRGTARVYGAAQVTDGVVKEYGLLHIVTGLLPWPVTASAPGVLSIGCETHDLETWFDELDEIAARHKVSEPVKAKVRMVLESARACPEAFPQESD